MTIHHPPSLGSTRKAPRVVWEDPPDEVREALEPMIDRWLGILPGWLYELHISFRPVQSDEPEADNLLSIVVQPEYRKAYLTAFPMWLDLDAESRELDLVHELLHVHVQPIAALLDQMLERLVDRESVFYKWVQDEIRGRVEGAVCDLVPIVAGDAR